MKQSINGICSASASATAMSSHLEASIFLFIGEVKFTRGFELSDTEEKVQEFMKILLEGSVVLVSMAASSVHASPLRNITSQLVRKFGGNTQGTPPTWYCLIGYYGQEMFPRIQEQKWSSGKPCDITSVIMLPGNTVVCATAIYVILS